MLTCAHMNVTFPFFLILHLHLLKKRQNLPRAPFHFRPRQPDKRRNLKKKNEKHVRKELNIRRDLLLHQLATTTLKQRLYIHIVKTIPEKKNTYTHTRPTPSCPIFFSLLLPSFLPPLFSLLLRSTSLSVQLPIDNLLCNLRARTG